MVHHNQHWLRGGGVSATDSYTRLSAWLLAWLPAGQETVALVWLDETLLGGMVMLFSIGAPSNGFEALLLVPIYWCEILQDARMLEWMARWGSPKM